MGCEPTLQGAAVYDHTNRVRRSASMAVSGPVMASWFVGGKGAGSPYAVSGRSVLSIKARKRRELATGTRNQRRFMALAFFP